MPTHIRPATLNDLKERELFADVSEEALEALLASSSICQLSPHETLHSTRDGVDYVYVILSGYLAIWINARFLTQRENFLAWRGPEQVIGEMRAIGDEPTRARILACEPCELIEIRSDTFTDIADSASRIYRNISRLLMKKMYQERNRSEVIQTPTCRRKVAQTLLHLAKERCSSSHKEKMNTVAIPGIVIQDEIAAYIGNKRETVNRRLNDFKDENIIDYISSKNGSEIVILDHDRLETIARK